MNRQRQPQADNLNYQRPRSPSNRLTSSRGSSTNTRRAARSSASTIADSSDRPDDALSNVADAATIRTVSPARDDDAMDTSTTDTGGVLVSDLRRDVRLVQFVTPEHMHARIANNINHEFEWFLNNHPDFSGRHHPQRKACVFACSPISIANGDHDAKNLPVLTADRLQLIQRHTRGYHYFVEDLAKNYVTASRVVRYANLWSIPD